jgi:hypothetical protein
MGANGWLGAHGFFVEKSGVVQKSNFRSAEPHSHPARRHSLTIASSLGDAVSSCRGCFIGPLARGRSLLVSSSRRRPHRRCGICGPESILKERAAAPLRARKNRGKVQTQQPATESRRLRRIRINKSHDRKATSFADRLPRPRALSSWKVKFSEFFSDESVVKGSTLSRFKAVGYP